MFLTSSPEKEKQTLYVMGWTEHHQNAVSYSTCPKNFM